MVNFDTECVLLLFKRYLTCFVSLKEVKMKMEKNKTKKPTERKTLILSVYYIGVLVLEIHIFVCINS